ncbi:MAG TPA: hypothetical protein VJV23_04000 [Candidatus Polarisedimenticolia bacterium]|nr:hypothetical protein [Candidatus Polarisedimenticolia bacterium]
MSHKTISRTAFIAAFLAACAWFGAVSFAGPRADNTDTPFDAALLEDLADGALDHHTLADAALIASGADSEEELARQRAKLDDVLREVAEGVRAWGGPERRAGRLLEVLHRSTLVKYDASSDRFADLLGQGTYNCVSATLLYIIAARHIGLDATAAETPLHVFVTLDTPMRRVDIEATSPTGFAVRRDLAQFKTFVLTNKYATAEELSQRGVETVFNEFHRLTRPVPPERVLAFLYHNAGLRALQARDPSAAARNLVSAARIYPHLAYRSEDLRTTLAWAIREQYDAGSFQAAYHLAEVAMRFYPERTTIKDRLIAVAARLVEEAAARGDLAAAEELEARTLSQLGDDESRRKMEILTGPVVARAALLARNWPSARRHAERFRAAYPDPIEAEKFARWVEARALEGSGPEDPGQAEFVSETRAVLAALPGAPGDGEAAGVTRGIGALAAQGRYEEALAVGRLQREALAEPAAREALDLLLKAVARRQINSLMTLRRWRDAGHAAEQALDQWPGDADLQLLHGRTIAASQEEEESASDRSATPARSDVPPPSAVPGATTAGGRQR